jgi:processive 1,2-diacylglycerol beta-glucosyltransferase
MAEYKRLYADSPPVVGIVTDFAVHAFWIHRNIDGYAVATEAVRELMIARGIAPERIFASGIPVRPEFVPGSESRAALRERLGLPLDRAIALLMGGGLGIGPLERMMHSLDAIDTPLAVVVVAGRNARAEGRVRKAAESVGYPVRVLRFVDNVYDYMHAADAFVTKPGGLSLAEALVANVPIVLYKPLPGQEERNARILCDAGAAVRPKRVDELPVALAGLLADPERRAKTIAAEKRLARPNAAGDAASMIARLVMERKEVVA